MIWCDMHDDDAPFTAWLPSRSKFSVIWCCGAHPTHHSVHILKPECKVQDACEQCVLSAPHGVIDSRGFALLPLILSGKLNVCTRRDVGQLTLLARGATRENKTANTTIPYLI